MTTKFDLTDLPDEDLAAELRRRAEAKQQRVQEERLARAERIRQQLSMTFIDIVAAEHGRTTCSDDNLANGWGSSINNAPRCNRCALLESLRDDDWPAEFYLDVQVRLSRYE